jgi:hypothetical protein
MTNFQDVACGSVLRKAWEVKLFGLVFGLFFGLVAVAQLSALLQQARALQRGGS